MAASDVYKRQPTGSPVPLVEIVVGEVIIRVGPEVSEAALRRILRAVRSA